MPLAKTGDSPCYYRLEGADDRPVLMLVHSLGLDHGMWDPQAADLAAHFRVLRYDIRGHGGSAATPGDYSIEQLGEDAIALAHALGIDRFAFCGLSIGGMIGLWLAQHHPHRLTSLVVANTSASPGRDRMEARRQTVLADGMPAVVDAVLDRFFLPATFTRRRSAVDYARRTLLATNPVGYAGCCAAVRDADLTGTLDGIRTPTLVIGSEVETSLPWDPHGETIARRIPGARVEMLPTGHISNLESPRGFLAALFDFLLPAATDPQAAGLTMRRLVLGDAHVDRALATAISPPFQELITSYAWGSIWTRPGLDLRSRRLLALSIAAATNRWEEFRMHVRTGLAAELEWRDLEEVLLHTAIYAGVPAANTGFHLAADERQRLASERARNTAP